jgi:hypothetical protein
VAGFKKRSGFICEGARFRCVIVHDAFRPWFQTVLYIVPCGISGLPACRTGAARGKSALASVTGEGAPGPSGPRTGNSSGLRPGNSSGLGDSPGSCIGGGTSGRGSPGGLSRGGSDGFPGLIGGSSWGSMGMSPHQRRGRGKVPPIVA